jgi:hypothetical protein
LQKLLDHKNVNQIHLMKKKPIKLLDTVALLEDLPERKLRAGEVGTVVEVLEEGVYEGRPDLRRVRPAHRSTDSTPQPGQGAQGGAGCGLSRRRPHEIQV